MNPTVIAAAIGVGGTVIVGLGGFWANVRSTSKTIQAARDTRIWDKRAEVYIAVVAAAHQRQTMREHRLTYRAAADREAEAEAKASRVAHSEPWHELESRLIAFGSHAVVTAARADVEAHKRAIGTFGAWQEAERKSAYEEATEYIALPVPTTAGEASTNIALPVPTTAGEASTNIALLYAAQVEARKAADTAGDDLIEIIRVELQGKSDPLSQFEMRGPDPGSS